MGCAGWVVAVVVAVKVVAEMVRLHVCVVVLLQSGRFEHFC
jgi:hypothetical protein